MDAYIATIVSVGLSSMVVGARSLYVERQQRQKQRLHWEALVQRRRPTAKKTDTEEEKPDPAVSILQALLLSLMLSLLLVRCGAYIASQQIPSSTMTNLHPLPHHRSTPIRVGVLPTHTTETKMARTITLCVMVALLGVTSPAPAEKQDPPCEQVCSMQYGPKWTDCKQVKECQDYVELQYRQCVQACEKYRH
jgi:hypothetical protein